MSLLKKHFNQTESLVRSIPSDLIADWLLKDGFFPEQYVYPPSFKTTNFILKPNAYYQIKIKKSKTSLTPSLSATEILNISYPKTELTDRIFGIYHPKYYHDLVYYIHKHWNQIVNHIFNNSNRIYSYSFPIPVTENSIGSIGKLRSGRMIYEYLELAEKDLLAESYKYKYLLKTDIKNFYPSIYTHSIAWALHTKKIIRRNNENNLRFVGNILDRLIQFANDRKTNGIPIGPAISDLISEIILTAVDTMVSKSIRKEKFIAARYKDDYFFLIRSEAQAQEILRRLQIAFKEFNLFLNEEKTDKYTLPDGLLRPWMLEFNKLWNSIKPDESKKLPFKNFLLVTQEVLKIDMNFPGTGTIDKFLSKLTNKDSNYSLHIDYSDIVSKKQAVLRTFSLLIHLSKRSKKSFPAVLGVLESLIRTSDLILPKSCKKILIDEFKMFGKDLENSEDEHKQLWWIYFVLSNSLLKTEIDIKKIYSKNTAYLRSFKKGKQDFFSDFVDCSLFEEVTEKIEYPISKHLDVFNKDK